MDFNQTGVTSLLLELLLLVVRWDKGGGAPLGIFTKSKLMVTLRFNFQRIGFWRMLLLNNYVYFFVTSSHIAKNLLM